MCETPDLGRLVAYCSHLGKLYTDKLLRGAGYNITPVQSRTLVYISCRREQPVTQRDLEQELHLKPSTVNGIVSRLEEKGFVLRRASPTDGRCRLVSLTEAGQKQVDNFETIADAAGGRIAACLTEEEGMALRALLIRIIENLENEVNKA